MNVLITIKLYGISLLLTATKKLQDYLSSLAAEMKDPSANIYV